jgi:adenylate cyclase
MMLPHHQSQAAAELTVWPPADPLGSPQPAPSLHIVAATVLFADVRGFTGLCENLGAAPAFALLNEFFQMAGACLRTEGCRFQRFIGDAVMAAFVVEPPADAARHAVRAALAIHRALRRWNSGRDQSSPRLEVGIGVNTDRVAAGYAGTLGAQEFTLIGDGVNVAARLEKVCKKYRCGVLLSESTAEHLNGAMATRAVDIVLLPGRTQPLPIFEVLEPRVALLPKTGKLLAAYNQAIALYRQQQFREAAVAFARALALNPDDPISQLYLRRCQRLLASAPDAGWTPVTTFASDGD